MKASLCTEYRERTLHRNMLLPFVYITESEQEIQTVSKVRKCSKCSLTSGSDSNNSSSSDSFVQIYRILQRRNTNTHTAVTPCPVTSNGAPAISHSSQSPCTDSILQPIPASPTNQSITGRLFTPDWKVLSVHLSPMNQVITSKFVELISPANMLLATKV
ncbi:hypothetical protein DPMN_056605 [Dreissena polymorpha]|uniref:Uncharacterized protein n=1 Tax=Dreissena polymorpha TaxID=45954 RepID=A0A9D4HTR9_DREPO|nr:hypothetical protein DPMN_056605 [Dreissena polymorpha]